MKQYLFKDYTEDEFIELIKENKIKEDLRDLLISSINCCKTKIATYLIKSNISFDYLNNLQYDAYTMAVTRGNIEIIKLLQEKNIDLFKTYNIDSKKCTALSYIRDINTLHFFEQNGATKNMIIESSEDIINATIINHNIELLKYLIDYYSIDITKIFYVTPSKTYTILEKAEEFYKNMKEILNRKREMTFFIDELFHDENNFEHIISKAYQKLNELENEVNEIKEYYLYVSSLYKND